MRPWLIPLLAALAPLASGATQPVPADLPRRVDEARYYRLETIPLPKEVVLEVGGMAYMPDQTLMICTRHGDVWSSRDGKWKRFATGLDEPMGICPAGPHQIVVAQRPELTRITDTDGDGVADVYEAITDAWHYSGHAYEWTFGPVQDRDGNLWGTLACWFYPTTHYEKPPYSGWEISPPAGYTPGKETAWRGWCFKVTPQGEFVPWATGLRSPNGLGFNPQGDLFVTDNQGEYFGACVLHHITQGAFHGHPNGLFWDKSCTGDPFSIPVEELDKRRKLAAIQFPYGVMGQSASQPLWDTTGGKFGPFAGQAFVGDQTKSTVMRVALEKVAGEYQGACFPFRSGFQCGNNRLAFAPDGSLYVGQTDRGWGSVSSRPYGLQRLVWTGAVPLEIQTMHLTPVGFDLTFTKPIDPGTATDLSAYSVQHFHYYYHRTYGSPQVDNTPVAVSAAQISEDRKTISLVLPELVSKKIYELHIRGLQAADGSGLLHPDAYYTLNRLQPSNPSLP
ncbi:MAG: DUF7133 domain-containing protein [Limisphaerales bacterium]